MKQKKPIIRRRWILFGLAVYTLLREGFFAYQHYRMSDLPKDSILIPPMISEIEPPMRPGLNGIWIMGAPVKTLYFEVNPYHAGSRSLQWNELPPNTRVKINCYVDPSGNLLIDSYEIEGHPAAGNHIIETLRTWKYRNLKTGEINFDFKLPSRREKLTIYTKLRRKASIPDSLEIFDGRLYNIDGIEDNELKIEKM
ncbi:hypothetical protein JW835_03575 [bacterium]|nr:hypothetical protein [bacterium]RQV98224.1 MAG: hypothetical protein EH221_02310 [bacterium]